MSQSMFDFIESVWIDRDQKPDWDAMLAKAKEEGLVEGGEFEPDVTVGIKRLRNAIEEGPGYGNDWSFIDVAQYRVWLGFDCGWMTADLDEYGVLEAGGFFQEPQCHCLAGPHPQWKETPGCPFGWVKKEEDFDD